MERRQTFEEIITPLRSAQGRLLGELWTWMMQHPYEQVWLVFKPSTATEYGQLGILHDSADGPNPPEGWEYMTPEAVPGNKTREQLGAWINQLTQRLPLLPSA